jgi:hypothetical protein
VRGSGLGGLGFRVKDLYMSTVGSTGEGVGCSFYESKIVGFEFRV